MRSIILCLLCSLSLNLFAQEICDNGIDDDGDGLFDIQDDDCSCNASSFAGVTADWEERTCCPIGVSFPIPNNQAFDCTSDGWNQLGTITTTDYFNTCGFLGNPLPQIPTPLPSGEGAIGISTFTSANPTVEGVAKCLDCSFIAGETYDVSVFIGFPSSSWLGTNTANPEFAIFGKESCDNFPSDFFGCPGDDGWTELVTFQLSDTPGGWVPVNVSFTSPGNYNAVAFAGSCAMINSNENISNYHFMDALEITGNFSGPGCGSSSSNATAQISGNCDAGFTINATTAGATQFQWYLDGIAIPGATTNPWFINPLTPGDYQVRAILPDGSCSISDPISFDPDLGSLSIGSTEEDPSCPGELDGSIDLLINSFNTPFNINWSTGDDTQTLENIGAGTYTVTVTDASGCFGEQTITLEDPEPVVSDVAIMKPTGGDGGSVSISTTGGYLTPTAGATGLLALFKTT